LIRDDAVNGNDPFGDIATPSLSRPDGVANSEGHHSIE
jgi:hypothetical protein